MTYFKAPYITVDFSEELNAVVSTWKGFVLPEESKMGLEKGLELLKIKNAKYSISDLRLNEGGYDEVNDWIINDYMPRVLATGYRAGATILPSDIFSQLSTEELSIMIASIAEIRTFGDINEAVKWIKAIQHQR